MSVWDGFDWDRFVKGPKTRARRAKKAECEMRRPLKAVLREIEQLPQNGADPRMRTHLDAFVTEAKAACIRTCGGCELTRSAPAPTPEKRKDCRRRVEDRLARLAEAQLLGVSVEQAASDIATRCGECRRCPTFSADIAFMRLGPPPSHSPR